MFSFLKSSGAIKPEPDHKSLDKQNEAVNHFRYNRLFQNFTRYAYPLTSLMSFTSLIGVASASKDIFIKFFEDMHNVTYQVHFKSDLKNYMGEVSYNLTDLCLLSEPEKAPITSHFVKSIKEYADIYASPKEIQETISCMVRVIDVYVNQIEEAIKDRIDENVKLVAIVAGGMTGGLIIFGVTTMLLIRSYQNYRRARNEEAIEEYPENQPLLNAEENTSTQQADDTQQQIQVIVAEEEDTYKKYTPDASKLLKERIELLSDAEDHFEGKFLFCNDKKAIDKNYTCPVLHTVMAEPCLTNDGHHYSKAGLAELEKHNMLISLFDRKTPIRTWLLDLNFKEKIASFVTKKENELSAFLNDRKKQVAEEAVTQAGKENNKNSENTFRRSPNTFFHKRAKSIPLELKTAFIRERRNSF